MGRFRPPRELAALAALLTLGAAPLPTVDYRLTAEVRDDVLSALEVRVSFNGDGDGASEVVLPDRFTDAGELWRNLRDVTVEGAAFERPEPSRLRLRHRPHAPVSVRYTIAPARREGVWRAVDYAPDVAPAGFFVLGETVFAHPRGLLGAPARFSFGPTPAGWTLASDLQPLAARPGRVEDVREGVAMGGRQVRLLNRRLADGSDLRVALRGGLPFADGAVADRLAAITEAQRRFWRERPAPALVAVDAVPTAAGVTLRAGVARSGGAALYHTAAAPGGRTAAGALDRLSEIAAHEGAHAWFARALGGLPRGADEVNGYWFSEGFADWFAFRTLLTIGVWDLADYARVLSADLSAAAEDQVDAARLRREYWTNPALDRAPYRRGLALALHWDQRVRGATSGRVTLDDVLRAQRARAATAGSMTAERLFPAMIEHLTDLDVASDLERHVVRGEPVRLTKDVFAGCLTFDDSDPRRLRPAVLDPPQVAACRRKLGY